MSVDPVIRVFLRGVSAGWNHSFRPVQRKANEFLRRLSSPNEVGLIDSTKTRGVHK